MEGKAENEALDVESGAWANSNRLGGSQYSEVQKMGSVRPNAAVTRLPRHITRRNCGLARYSASQGIRNPLDQPSHTY